MSEGISRCRIFAGAQFGDEGKGKIVDYFAERADACVRVAGGPNAGHTAIVEGQLHALHLAPLGILRRDLSNYIGPAAVIDPGVLRPELRMSEEHGSSIRLDERSPLILPLHTGLDDVREIASGADKIGTTKRGVGPVMEDFIARRGPRLGDLRSAGRLRAAMMDRAFYRERSLLLKGYGRIVPTINQLIEEVMQYADEIVPRLTDVAAEVRRRVHRGDRVLFELAQGVMLDPYQGGWPNVTSSLCTPAAVSATLGVYTQCRVTYVVKAYTTRVGSGAFPTLIQDERQQVLGGRGIERGTTTGRPRQCGWLDLPALRFACQGEADVVLTKLDILTGIDPIPVCVGYRFNDGHEMEDAATLTHELLSQAIPIFVDLPGWTEDISGCRTFADLPLNAQRYVVFIMNALKMRVSLIGVGRGREQVCSGVG